MNWTFPLRIGTISLDRLLYCHRWDCSSRAEGGFEVIFAASRLESTKVSGHLLWECEWDKRDVILNRVMADVPAFDCLDHGLDVCLDVHAAGDYGADLSGHYFGYCLYDRA